MSEVSIWAYPNDALPPTSLIICTRNRPVMLVETVESILQGEEVPSEIVILDQSPVCNEVLSTMPGRRGCHVRYVPSTSVGLSRARNEGIAAAKHRLLVIADDDMFIDRKWFGSMVRTLLREGPRCVVSGAVVPSEAEVAGGFAPSLTLSDTPACHAGRPFLDPLNAGNMAMFRSAYEEIGEFDPHLGTGSAFRSAEDNDYGYRLLESGYRVFYEPTAIIIHRAWRSADQYLPMRWNYGFGQGAFFAKHMRRDDGYIRQRMWRDVKKRALRFKERIWHERQLAKGDAVYCIGLLVGAVRWTLTFRKSRQRTARRRMLSRQISASGLPTRQVNS